MWAVLQFLVFNWIVLWMPNLFVTNLLAIFEINPRWSSLALLWMFNPFLQPVSEQKTISSKQANTREVKNPKKRDTGNISKL